MKLEEAFLDVKVIWNQLSNASQWFDAAKGTYSTYDCMRKLYEAELQVIAALDQITKLKRKLEKQ